MSGAFAKRFFASLENDICERAAKNLDEIDATNEEKRRETPHLHKKIGSKKQNFLLPPY